MYKWIWNFLRITGNPERIGELKERANLDGRVFNFEAFVPVGKRYPDYRQTEKDIEKLELENRDNLWGTEQNAKDAKIKEEEPDSIFYTFQTAVKILATGPYGECKNFQNSPAKVARALKKLYPDLDIDWCCQGPREWSSFDIEFDYFDENGGLLDTWEDPRMVFRNTVTMDEENIEKFKKLYDKDEEWNWFSLAMVIPEPANDAEEWTDYTDLKKRDVCTDSGLNKIQKDDIGPSLAAWRYENWGTPSEAMPSDIPLLRICCFWRYQLMGDSFYTLSFPPFKIYRKMAADGLVFKATWKSDAYGYWAYGEGQVVDGCFRYECGPITGFEKRLIMNTDVFRLRNRDCGVSYFYDGVGIIVKNRKHLDQLLECVLDKFGEISDSLNNQGSYGIDEIGREDFSIEETEYGIKYFKLNKTLDLNFLDVSRVTDMSGLFKHWNMPLRNIYAKLDISKWDVSNVTKMALMFDGCENVDFGDLSRWDCSKVTDC